MAVVQEAPTADHLACETCAAENPSHARFCKACGGALAPPPACPKCSVDVPRDARFCPGCGARLIGPRPVPDLPKAPAPAPTPAEAEVAAAAAALPAARPVTSNVGSNVLLFVAILLVLIAVIYTMNKDAELEVSPFAGGPPPARTAPDTPAAAASPAAPAAPAAPAGAPLTGVVKLGEGMQAPSGTLFVIVRNAGVKRGPPLAVKKVDNPELPYIFSVGASDVMMKGMPFTGPFDVQVRLDQDGNAMTKAAGDLVASEAASGVAAGAEVEVVLDKRL